MPTTSRKTIGGVRCSRQPEPVARPRRALRASYLIANGDQIEHRRVEYDLEKVAGDYFSSGYPIADSYVSWLRTGEWTPS